MNKSILLGLVLAMMVPAVALADGISISGDLRLRWDYGSGDDAGVSSSNNAEAEVYLNLSSGISDNLSWAASVRHDMTYNSAGGGGTFAVQEAYVSIGDLGSAASFLGGWSMDLGRMNSPNQGSGRVMHSDNWSLTAGPNNNDGYHLASEMGGIGIDVYSFQSAGTNGAGTGASMTGVSADLGAMGGFADLAIHYWGDNNGTNDPSNLTLTIGNVGGDNLAGLDLDIEYATRDNDDGGDDGTLTAINVSYGLGDMGMTVHASSTVADADWNGMTAANGHGTNGISDLAHGVGASAADVDNMTVGLDFSPMDGVDATVNYITLTADGSGDGIGTEIDLILSWACTDATSMEIGYASFTADDDNLSGQGDEDFFYIGTGWSL